MTDAENSPIPLQHRMLASLAYLGLAPYLLLRRKNASGTFLPFQIRQALGVFALLGLVAVVGAVCVAIISYVMVYHRELFDAHPVEAYLLSFLRKLFLCWLVVWGFGTVLAAAGSWRIMPLVWRLANRDRLIRMTAVLLIAIQALTGFAILLSLHGHLLTRQDSSPAQVYFLYEDVDTFPRWFFVLGFYPIALAAHRCFGPGEVIVEQLNRDSIVRAIEAGAFVFIGSHGTRQGLMVPEGYFEAHEVQDLRVSDQLRFVYLTGCDQKTAWVDAFSPAQVVTYDRLTAVVEHIWWMWRHGPRVVCQVASESGG